MKDRGGWIVFRDIKERWWEILFDKNLIFLIIMIMFLRDIKVFFVSKYLFLKYCKIFYVCFLKMCGKLNFGN